MWRQYRLPPLLWESSPWTSCLFQVYSQCDDVTVMCESAVGGEQCYVMVWSCDYWNRQRIILFTVLFHRRRRHKPDWSIGDRLVIRWNCLCCWSAASVSTRSTAACPTSHLQHLCCRYRCMLGRNQVQVTLFVPIGKFEVQSYILHRTLSQANFI